MDDVVELMEEPVVRRQIVRVLGSAMSIEVFGCGTAPIRRCFRGPVRNRIAQTWAKPPSTVTSEPVMYEESLLARKTATLAISSA